ncbi:MAG: HAMP domain-containing protein [Desulfuromonadaceae bacterium]|nr:HAMP domain-containing protein [Desulfuromonadaceae bacterium]
MSPAPTENRRHSELRKRRREWLVIISVVVLVGLLARFETRLFDLTEKIPQSGSVLMLVLININILLIVLFLFLVFRNVFKLLLERRRGLPGSHLRTKLVLVFIGLSLVPTMLLFFVSAGFINNTIENWFSDQIDSSLQESLEVAQTYYKNSATNALYYAEQLALFIKDEKLLNENNLPRLVDLIHRKQQEYNLGVVEVFSSALEELARASNPDVPTAEFTDPGSENLRAALQGKRFTLVTPIGKADLIRGIVPVFSNWKPNDVVGAVVVNYYVPYSLVSKMKEIAESYDQYKETKLLKNKIQQGYVIVLLLIALVIIFLATWFGFHLARGITVPIQELAAATNRIAAGDLEVTIDVRSDDEIGTLIDAFNQMTTDLRRGQQEIKTANDELKISNQELDQRRSYMEILLRNVTAGVISLDNQGTITTINKSAEELLQLSSEQVLGNNFRTTLSIEQFHALKELLQELQRAGRETLQRQINLPVGNTTITIFVSLTTLHDENNAVIGSVIVFDDLTQLLKAQRMAAWREVARRIAHEIKNPLTPIQLSAQRLRRRYLERFSADDTVFDECTRMIVQQVEELKNLVNEFSSFARMPASNPTPNDLNEIIAESLVLYQEGHKDLSFTFTPDKRLPLCRLDREQIKRVLINLLDNAVDATGEDGRIELASHFDPSLKIISFTVADNGCGIAANDKLRLFEPYYTTKKSGTGLGLAIVSTIISDHNGYIRVKDNYPQGTLFVVELPVFGSHTPA